MSDKKISSALMFLVALLSLTPLAHAKGIVFEGEGLHDYLQETSVNYILVAGAIVAAIIIFSMFYRKKKEKAKWALFIGIAVTVVLATAYSAGSTIYINLISDTQGPVHWHADFEIWSCGEKVDIVDPTGFVNRVGEPIIHEHGDDRIHVEGVLVDVRDAALANFFKVIGGELRSDSMSVPTNTGALYMRNGDLCGGEEGKLQVFVYRVTNPDDTKRWSFVQEKLADFPNYVMSPHTSIPPGDCVIIEFGEEKARTEHMCNTYRVAIERGDLSGG